MIRVAVQQPTAETSEDRRTRPQLNPTPSALEFGAWLSSVERCVRDAEVPGSNPGAPTRMKYQMCWRPDLRARDSEHAAAAEGGRQNRRFSRGSKL